MAGSVLTGYLVELMTLFGVVLIHELGHVAAAKSFGWRVTEVRLLPFGGVAITEESSNVPAREELLVALCGPLQNLWMAGFALLFHQMGWGDPDWWMYFLQANVMIGAFNLLPVLPLDGGKIVHALLSYTISYHRALSISTWLSLFLSIMVVTASLVLIAGGGIHANLLIIGLFLFYSNWYGYKHLSYQFLRFLVSRERRFFTRGTRGSQVASPLIVASHLRPMEVFRQFMRERYHFIYVTGKDGNLLQVLPEEKLLERYFERLPPAPPTPVAPPKIG